MGIIEESFREMYRGTAEKDIDAKWSRYQTKMHLTMRPRTNDNEPLRDPYSLIFQLETAYNKLYSNTIKMQDQHKLELKSLNARLAKFDLLTSKGTHDAHTK